MPKQEILNRRQFQADLASSLILRGRPSSGNGSPAATVTSRSPLIAQKRPSSGDGSPPNGAPSKRSQPPLDVRKDLVAHFPGKTKRGRCRHCSKGYTNTQCIKSFSSLSDDSEEAVARYLSRQWVELGLTDVHLSNHTVLLSLPGSTPNTITDRSSHQCSCPTGSHVTSVDRMICPSSSSPTQPTLLLEVCRYCTIVLS
ncbi:hypothetical protein F7725_028213 [Dissostichus mawsoni]|uniref:Uncharacterized protein n=1 Tax=Dissostichus mawsoni TaxID=36200 RepID=A0A7J5XF22_DISMA|nr:hypothetical protein F7725_028213 [Dissostichus mawsoni]